MENQNLESEPIRETGQADEQDGKPQTGDATASPLVVEGEAEAPNPSEGESETDRKQDEAIDSIAEQTKWIKAQTIASIMGGRSPSAFLSITA